MDERLQQFAPLTATFSENYSETKLALQVVIEHKSLESVGSVVGETVEQDRYEKSFEYPTGGR